MKFSSSSLFCYLATAGVVSGVAATSAIKDSVGAGGENAMSFKLSYGNADGSTCTTCDLCEGSALQDAFDIQNTSLCISCTDEDGCDEAIITTSFKTSWRMTYVSLSSHVGDNAFDPESITILGSNNYDEGSKMGSWTILATTSSDLLFTKRNESQDIAVDNVALLSHYRFVFTRKDNSSPMKIGHVGVVQSYLKMYSVQLFETLTESKVVGSKAPTTAPTSKPTSAPTYPIGPEFTNESLKVAVDEWIANRPDTLQKYGEMKYWGASKVTSMEGLFRNKNTFNEDLTHWDTGNVTSMGWMFYTSDVFNGDVSQWNVSAVTQMESMFNKDKQFNQDVSGWDTRSLLDMDWMFQDAFAFNVDVSNWNISSVTRMVYVFERATGFKQQICWDTSGKEATEMFKGSPGSNRC